MSPPRLSDEQSIGWNQWGMEVVDFHLKRVMRRGGWLWRELVDAIGNSLARERRLMREHVKGELEALRREIAELRNEIKAQRAADTS